MMTVVGCILYQHNLWLVLMAAIICACGSWAMVRLYLRAATASSLERFAWVVLAAFVTGASIWCTHFVAMLGYEPGLPVGFDPVLTIVSLLVAMTGSGLGFLIATAKPPLAHAIGGAIVGLSIVLMHYIGMLAYRVQGLVSWDMSYLMASILISCVLAAASVATARRLVRERAGPHLATVLFFLSIIGLHFTGMTAFKVTPMLVDGSFSNPEALSALAFSVTCVGLFIVGSGFACSFIDTKARATAADALANMSNGLAMLSPGGVLTLVNERVGQLFGLEPEALKVGMTLRDFLGAIGAKAGWDKERLARVTDNHLLWMRKDTTTRIEQTLGNGAVLSIVCQPVGRGGAILTYEDVTETRNGQKTIAHMAFHDALTGLKNRRMFTESIEELLPRGEATMMAIDLDHFKGVNDRLGHAVGDELLRQVAARLEARLRSGELAFRLGGDELAVLLRAPRERIASLAHEITTSMAIPFEIDGNAITTGCTIGVATAALGDDASILQQKADLALYSAKKAGRNRFEIYRDGMLEEEAKKRALEQDLSAAAALGQLELWYQPLYSLPGRTLSGFEALIRWRHPERGLVPPGEFIPVAESSGLISAIGAWVIDAACRQAALWPAPLYVSINVSALQLRSAALPLQIGQALARYNLPPSRIEIEITETAMVEHSDQITMTLTSLRALGVRIAMDDFGTGYSSLAHLREFKIDRLKIDRSFVSASEHDSGAAAIVRAVLSMARELDIDTTAEGIEEEAQLARLMDLGCGTAQGYLLGRPLDERAVSDFMVDHADPPPLRLVV